VRSGPRDPFARKILGLFHLLISLSVVIE